MRILNYEVETIEEQQDIDIQAIEEIKWRESDKEYLADGVLLASDKINQLIKVIKQLDKKINKE